MLPYGTPLSRSFPYSRAGAVKGRCPDLNLAQTRGDKFIRFFLSLLSFLYLACGSTRIVVLTLEKQHVFDRLTP